MNKNLLRSKMAMIGDNYSILADYLGIALATFSLKINEKGAEFTQTEINKIRTRYSLTDEEVIDIFFANKVS